MNLVGEDEKAPRAQPNEESGEWKVVEERIGEERILPVARNVSQQMAQTMMHPLHSTASSTRDELELTPFLKIECPQTRPLFQDCAAEARRNFPFSITKGRSKAAAGDRQGAVGQGGREASGQAGRRRLGHGEPTSEIGWAESRN